MTAPGKRPARCRPFPFQLSGTSERAYPGILPEAGDADDVPGRLIGFCREPWRARSDPHPLCF
jgi:hypothetical protein